MGKRSRQRNRNLGIEKPCSPPRSQGSNVNTRILTTPSIIQDLSKNQVYDAGDVAEGFTLAYEQVSDLSAMLTVIRSEFKKNIEYVQRVYKIPDPIFSDLERLINITNVLINQSLEFSQEQENHYRNKS